MVLAQFCYSVQALWRSLWPGPGWAAGALAGSNDIGLTGRHKVMKIVVVKSPKALSSLLRLVFGIKKTGSET